jgi:hypothetical protein
MDWPFIGADSQMDSAADLVNSNGVDITPGLNSKGSYAQLLAATSVEYAGLHCYIRQYNNVALDIAIGAAGSEQIVIPNLLFQGTQYSKTQGVFIPLAIPRGVRLAARSAQSNTTYHSQLAVVGVGRALRQSFQCCDSYGFSSSNTQGTQVDPGTSAGTKGAWATICSSLTRAAHALIIAIGSTVAPSNWYQWLADIAIGSAGNEVVIIPNLLLSCGSPGSDIIMPNFFGPFMCSLPAGTRIAMRAQSNETDSNRYLYAMVYSFI